MYINLIKPEEIRSSSAIRRVFLIQLSIGLGVVVLLSLLATIIWGSISASQKRKSAEIEKGILMPQYNNVVAMKRELKEIESLANVVEGLYQNRINWYEILRNIQKEISPNMQLTRFNVGETLGQVDGSAAQIYTIYLQGKVTGDRSEEDVKQIIETFKASPLFTNIVESAEVRRYVASDVSSEKDFRIFDIECVFKPIKIGK